MAPLLVVHSKLLSMCLVLKYPTRLRNTTIIHEKLFKGKKITERVINGKRRASLLFCLQEDNKK